ncbi:MAG TPA: aminotransferase class I/II-fold pyridoxal phosphate-dependent enzyme [Thermoanaerobaculia bacterium]|nr:aminotransferase class I/II-fold pyridoxal phosphate-dependent enzyme [Thermoanaerobaculia bacterium]
MRLALRDLTAYTLEVREAHTKLNQNESPDDLPAELKRGIVEEALARPWNRYPDFESSTLRNALAREYGLAAENILTGNGSNELLAAAITAFVAPGTQVVMLRPSFTLYEKLTTIAGGVPRFIDADPASPLLPARDMIRLASTLDGPLVIACSPNNPTGGVLPAGALDALLGTGATVFLDRAYGDFAGDTLPPLHDRLVTFSTFSKAWGLAALRIGWLAATAATAREIRKVTLPYNLNVISEAAAVIALRNRAGRDETVARTIRERERAGRALAAMRSVEVFPSAANFIAFRIPDAHRTFEALCARGVLVRDISSYPGLAGCLRVSIGSAAENDAFLAAIEEVL